MYITVSSIKKTLGKYIEMKDLYIGLPLLFIFLLMFSFSNYKLFSFIFLTISIWSFGLLPKAFPPKATTILLIFY